MEAADGSPLAERLESGFRVGPIPRVYVVPDFITKQEEDDLLSSARSSTARWTVLSNRRLQTLGAGAGVALLKCDSMGRAVRWPTVASLQSLRTALLAAHTRG